MGLDLPHLTRRRTLITNTNPFLFLFPLIDQSLLTAMISNLLKWFSRLRHPKPKVGQKIFSNRQTREPRQLTLLTSCHHCHMARLILILNTGLVRRRITQNDTATITRMVITITVIHRAGLTGLLTLQQHLIMDRLITMSHQQQARTLLLRISRRRSSLAA